MFSKKKFQFGHNDFFVIIFYYNEYIRWCYLLIRLKELRESRQWTQEKLGEILKVQKSAISKYETGRIALTTDLIISICNEFNVSADYLLGLSNRNNYNFQKQDEIYELFEMLDEGDKREIKGEIKGMLRAEKYNVEVREKRA